MVVIYQSNKFQGETTPKFAGNNIPRVKEEQIKRDTPLAEYMDSFLCFYEARLALERNDLEPKIKVSQILGRFAKLYERIRTSVEYKGEHLLRRNAIQRILKRLVWERNSLRQNIDSKKISQTLIKELIWASYLPNDFLPVSTEKQLEMVVDKYLFILSNFNQLPPAIPKRKLENWIWGIASSEIEDLVDPSNRDLYVKLMYDWFNSYFDWKDEEISEEEKRVQIFIAIHRSLPRSDDSIIRYHLLLKEFPDWQDAKDQDLKRFIFEFTTIYESIENALDFSESLTLYRKIQKYSPSFEIIKAVCSQEGIKARSVFENEKRLEKKIKGVCREKYAQIRQRVNTGIVRSIIYIFLTKVVFALFLEVPYEVIRLGDIRYIPLSLNIITPPLLMFVIGLSIKTPGIKNTQRIIDSIKLIIYRRKDVVREEFSIKRPKGTKTLISFFSILYLLLFLLVFGGITYLLVALNFSVFGILVFFMFLSLVLLFSYRVRYQATRLKVEADSENFFSEVLNFLTLPLINLGYFLSSNLSKLNFLTVVLDFIIETPLKNIIEIFEEWMKFLREKREEVIEVPE